MTDGVFPKSVGLSSAVPLGMRLEESLKNKLKHNSIHIWLLTFDFHIAKGINYLHRVLLYKSKMCIFLYSIETEHSGERNILRTASLPRSHAGAEEKKNLIKKAFWLWSSCCCCFSTSSLRSLLVFFVCFFSIFGGELVAGRFGQDWKEHLKTLTWTWMWQILELKRFYHSFHERDWSSHCSHL